VTRRTHSYPPQALLVYVALGIALGLVGWALWLHDGQTGDAGGGQPPVQQQQQERGGERP
jgi:hypothetical protein